MVIVHVRMVIVHVRMVIVGLVINWLSNGYKPLKDKKNKKNKKQQKGLLLFLLKLVIFQKCWLDGY